MSLESTLAEHEATSQSDAAKHEQTSLRQWIWNLKAPQTAPYHPTLALEQADLKKKAPICGAFAEPSDGLEPSTSSLPWRFRGVTRVHARPSATQFLLQIRPIQAENMRREASRVSFLMCPFCVRGGLLLLTTEAFRA
jgi:hypothetical protein